MQAMIMCLGFAHVVDQNRAVTHDYTTLPVCESSCTCSNVRIVELPLQ